VDVGFKHIIACSVALLAFSLLMLVITQLKKGNKKRPPPGEPERGP
jgi:hypothetical protein